MEIPHIIHQTWKDENIPLHLKSYVETWKIHHPGWDYILWTDVMNREFILEEAPGFMSVYDGYPYAIQRVDAVRYFILKKYGGVFVDLDFECLKCIAPLLHGAQFVAGLEPDTHARSHQKDIIISNAFMASVPGGSFIQALCENVMRNNFLKYYREPGFNYVLDCAGPFMLTKAYKAFDHKEQIAILPAEVLFPLIKDSKTGAVNRENIQLVKNTAYAIHHYWGSWWHG